MGAGGSVKKVRHMLMKKARVRRFKQKKHDDIISKLNSIEKKIDELLKKEQ